MATSENYLTHNYINESSTPIKKFVCNATTKTKAYSF